MVRRYMAGMVVIAKGIAYAIPALIVAMAVLIGLLAGELGWAIIIAGVIVGLISARWTLSMIRLLEGETEGGEEE